MKRKVCTKTTRHSDPVVKTVLKATVPRLAVGDLEPPASCALLRGLYCHGPQEPMTPPARPKAGTPRQDAGHELLAWVSRVHTLSCLLRSGHSLREANVSEVLFKNLTVNLF